MRLVFFVEDSEHCETAGLNIKEEAKINHISEDEIINNIVDEFWQFADSWELNCHLADIELKVKEIREKPDEKGI